MYGVSGKEAMLSAEHYISFTRYNVGQPGGTDQLLQSER